MSSRIFLKLVHMIADHGTTSELEGFHAQFPITFHILQGSNHFLRATGIHLVNRGIFPFPRPSGGRRHSTLTGPSERYSRAILAIRTSKCASRSWLYIGPTFAGIESQLAGLLSLLGRQPEFQYATNRIQYLRDFISSKARNGA